MLRETVAAGPPRQHRPAVADQSRLQDQVQFTRSERVGLVDDDFAPVIGLIGRFFAHDDDGADGESRLRAQSKRAQGRSRSASLARSSSRLLR